MKHVNDQLHMDDNAPANTLDAFLHPQNILFVFICTYISMHMYMHFLAQCAYEESQNVLNKITNVIENTL